VRVCGLESNGSGLDTVGSSCERVNIHSGFIKKLEFLDSLND
jgi:hypothetical protein